MAPISPTAAVDDRVVTARSSRRRNIPKLYCTRDSIAGRPRLRYPTEPTREAHPVSKDEAGAQVGLWSSGSHAFRPITPIVGDTAICAAPHAD